VVALESDHVFKIVSVPLFQLAVFTGREEEMRARNKLQSHDRVLVSEDGTVAVTKVQTLNM
jgi:hypothetical protein